MNELLTIGQTVKSAKTQIPCKVEQFLGGGGQGEVYRANMAGSPVALKWYYPQTATPEQRASLETLIRHGSPNDRFLWPIDIMTFEGTTTFGYTMPLRASNYKSIVDMMKRRADPSFRALATAGFQLADSYLTLHARGFSYRDISFGNVFFDPTTGEVLICDNDNVAVDGTAAGGVLGTPRFMAPEIVRGESSPSTQTDQFSLSVLLFYMFIVHHPLEGKKEASIRCMDLPAMNKLYGTDPLFIFDPLDDSNRPVPGYQDNPIEAWPIFPGFLRDTFTKAFTTGLRDPGGRVVESEWKKVLLHLRDSIYYCGNCGAENFYDEDALKAAGGAAPNCWSCKKALHLPIRIRISKDMVIMLNHDTKLYPHHIDVYRLYDFSAPAAEMTRHPTDPNIWGLKNLTSGIWTSTTPGGEVKQVEPGKSVTIARGTKIAFGNTEGELRA